MKQLGFFFIFPIFAIAAQAECIGPSLSSTYTPFLNLEKVSDILSSQEMSSSEKYKKLELLNVEEAKMFLKNLEAKEQKIIEDLINSVKVSKKNLIPLYEKIDQNPVLMVSGFDFRDFPTEWIKPFHTVVNGKKSSYFFKWDRFDSINKNSTKLGEAIKEIKEKHPGKELTIIGYSAGGIIALDAFDNLTESDTLKNVKLLTVAAPIHGYNAPALAKLGTPFFGKTTIQIGMGHYQNLKHKQFENCSEWITTSCELDQHACTKEGNNPQTGKSNESLCKNSKPILINNEGHSSVLNRVVSDFFKD